MPAPEQMVADTGLILTTGGALTVTTIVWVAVHVPLFPVTVYVVVTEGEAVTEAPVVALRPAAGAQVYVVAPLAVTNEPVPLHIVSDAGAIVTVGEGFTFITLVTASVQPTFVPVTVYVVVVAGLAVTVAPVVALSPVEGLHA
jgi:hypothetical protein